MTSGQVIRKDASPNSRKNRWLRFQEIHSDIDKLDKYIEELKYGPEGTLALISLRERVLRPQLTELEKGGF